jgi:hypothetical protein
MLTQLGALFVLALTGMLVAMPSLRAGATESEARAPLSAVKLPRGDAMNLLLSPAPLSSERFMAYYMIAYR